MTLFTLHSMNNDIMANTILSVHAFNDFNGEFEIYKGTWGAMPSDYWGLLVRCFGTLDNGEIYIELEPGEENL